ncbi:hypothetical protein Sinac_1644 [Singulisphaera acidiphila DSM 18658]|uniref:Uncharacterized protein n=1 Tax=Singulisphaera acidiphila (strain ATCC BAA-1392 / DSM 18658 / VKM B-2454 / MOB10) TaxID=886293 RepID=L0D9V1_SINAD|nr:hypothetical protein Sinac_1644 [Singulisphaera acidiphila DSM 18658]
MAHCYRCGSLKDLVTKIEIVTNVENLVVPVVHTLCRQCSYELRLFLGEKHPKLERPASVFVKPPPLGSPIVKPSTTPTSEPLTTLAARPRGGKPTTPTAPATTKPTTPEKPTSKPRKGKKP